jgi:predicted ArsR family transcriptional regulator
MAKRGTHQVASSSILSEPRGRLLAELCGHPRTAAELADRVGTSSNAVRVHLNALREGGLVEFEVERRGVGKPTHRYSLTSAGEYFLSSAYAPVLRAILETLRQELDGRLAPWLRRAGAMLAGQRPPTASRSGEITRGIELLRSLGAVVSTASEGRATILRTACCPLGAATRSASESCKILEGALDAVLSSHRVRERCERGDHPHCVFVISRVAPARENAR